MEERLQIGVKHLHTKLMAKHSLLVGTSKENVGWTPYYFIQILLFQLDIHSFIIHFIMDFYVLLLVLNYLMLIFWSWSLHSDFRCWSALFCIQLIKQISFAWWEKDRFPRIPVFLLMNLCFMYTYYIYIHYNSWYEFEWHLLIDTVIWNIIHIFLNLCICQ